MLSRSKWEPFSEYARLRRWTRFLNMYQLLGSAPLHFLHLSKAEILKETVIAYSSSDPILTNLRQTSNKWKPLIQVRRSVYCRCNAIHLAIAKNCRGIKPVSNQSGEYTSSGLSGIFTSNISWRMSEGKDYYTLDMVLKGHVSSVGQHDFWRSAKLEVRSCILCTQKRLVLQWNTTQVKWQIKNRWGKLEEI